MIHQSKVAPPVKGIGWMKVVNKISFENGPPPSANEYWAPPGVIFAFYTIQDYKNIFFYTKGRKVVKNVSTFGQIP